MLQSEAGRQRRTGRKSAPLAFSSLFVLLVLAGCAGSPINLDPGGVNGRDGGGPVPSYPMLMRIGAAAQASGDLPSAVGVYRRAAEIAPQEPAPLIAAGDTLLQMGAVNEAIVSYNQALVRPGDTQGAQVGLAKAFLMTGKPQLGLAPLSKALEASPQDPKLLPPRCVEGFGGTALGSASLLPGRSCTRPRRAGSHRQSRLISRSERRLFQCDSRASACRNGAYRIATGATDLGSDLWSHRKCAGSRTALSS